MIGHWMGEKERLSRAAMLTNRVGSECEEMSSEITKIGKNRCNTNLSASFYFTLKALA